MSKPSWDTSRPGKHPALAKPVTQDEIDAVRRNVSELANSMGRAMMSGEEKWHADAIARARAHRANLDLFIALKDGPSARLHRQALARALMDLGEFDEVEAVVAPKGSKPGSRALAGFGKLRSEASALRRAVERDDQEVCACPREAASIPHPNPQAHVQQNPIELRRRHSLGWVFSKKHGKVVTIWRCRHCGDLNAHDLIPEGHLAQVQHRALLEAEAQRRQAGGRGVKGAFFTIDPAFGDHELLRPR
ncbi:MAG TPA: hypothetical protein VN345_04770 [Blastocatellia bacterium]|nr:hypothetical protein [Blastocatellia bacterium]